MAVFSPGSMIGAISGKVGGATFVNKSGSKIIRKTQAAGRSQNALQLRASQRVARFSKYWQTLTTDQQKAWETFASNQTSTNAVGVQRSLSGYQQWMKRQLFVGRDTAIIVEAPPIGATYEGRHSWTLTSDVVTGIKIDFTNPAGNVFNKARIYGRPLFRDTLPKFNNSWTDIGQTSSSTQQFDITTAWAAAFLPPVENQVIAIRVKAMTDPEAVIEGVFDLFAITTP